MDKLNNESLKMIIEESQNILQGLARAEDIQLITEQMTKRNKLIFQLLDELPVSARETIMPELLAIRENEDKALIPYRQQLKDIKQTLQNIDSIKAYTV